jgi:mercuric ion binding protein
MNKNTSVTLQDGAPEKRIAAAASEQNAEHTQAFTIEKMTCAACPITVKKVMQRVDGVTDVAINFDTKTAVATFDPALTNADEIAAASTNVGYPATAIENDPQ